MSSPESLLLAQAAYDAFERRYWHEYPTIKVEPFDQLTPDEQAAWEDAAIAVSNLVIKTLVQHRGEST